MEDRQEWWVGNLAMAIRNALRESPEHARSRLQETLARFRASPACTVELDRMLGARTPRPRKSEPVVTAGEFDLNTEWKPCANPECRTPIPRRSRKIYCDKLCERIGLEYADEETSAAGRNLQTDDIPF